MARRKVGRYNEVKVDLASYDYYLRGEGGIGEVLPSQLVTIKIIRGRNR